LVLPACPVGLPGLSWSISMCLLLAFTQVEKDFFNKVICLEEYTLLGNIYNNELCTMNGITRFKIVKNCLNTNIYSYLETCGGQTSNLNLNVVHFFNTTVN
jgi:hypothetical protein